MKRTLPPPPESKRLPAPPPQRERTPTVYLFSTSARKKFYHTPQTPHNTLSSKPLHYTLFSKYLPPPMKMRRMTKSNRLHTESDTSKNRPIHAYSPALRRLVLENARSAIERDLHFWNASGCLKTKAFRRQILQNAAIPTNGLLPRVREFLAPERISQKYNAYSARGAA